MSLIAKSNRLGAIRKDQEIVGGRRQNCFANYCSERVDDPCNLVGQNGRRSDDALQHDGLVAGRKADQIDRRSGISIPL